MSRWYIKPNGRASVDREKFYSSNEFIGVIKKAGEIMGAKREDGRCFDGGTCGRGGFCDHCPLTNDDETGNFEALVCASESIGNLKDQLAALKEDNEAQLLRLEIERDRLKARVAELEEGSISKALFISRLQKLPDEHRMNMCSAEIICEIIMSIIDGDFDHKEPDNEG